MLSIILKRVQNARNYLSNERLCMKFGRFFEEIYWKKNIRKIRRRVHTEICVVFKVKNREKFPSGSAKCNWTWKSSLFNSRNRCKVVVPDEFGRELEHFNWALFRRFITDSHTYPLQSTCKSVYLKTERDKTCKVRINADSFSLTKILMELMRSRRTLTPLGQFFFDFRSFLSVASHWECRFEISGDVKALNLYFEIQRISGTFKKYGMGDLTSSSMMNTLPCNS